METFTVAQGKYQRAIQDHDEQIRLHPNHAAAYLGRAAAKESLGDKQGAAEDRKRSEELKGGPSNPPSTSSASQPTGSPSVSGSPRRGSQAA